MLSDEEKKDILFQIDMQLYDEFNDKFCEMNDNLGTVYSYKDLDDLEKLEKETEIKLLRQAIEKQSKEIEELENQRQNGTLSDGYHTYNDLYYQRCVLFATICNLNKNISWKSKKHNDGKKCFNSDEWFIVGIDTPKGSYTYHYEIKYWDMFEVQELEKGKFWDGHTEKDVTRLLSLIDNYTSNDKIKAKIEEVKDGTYDAKIVLQSLLEKE